MAAKPAAGDRGWSDYFTKISNLHDTCFYSGLCGPNTEHRILEAVQYIDDAQALAAG